MKKKLIFLSIVLTTMFLIPASRAQEKATAGAKQEESAVIRRGQALTGAAPVKLEKLLAEPRSYEEKTVAVEGVVERACTNKGCWMEIAPQSGASGMRVTFKDYGFFVPLNSKGMTVKAEGQVSVKTLSRAQADHYESEGATLKRNADGTAHEVTFIATGIELAKKAAL